ncbi:MAG: Lrp/AsnC family transcriptional regulator [Burkholderiales bacterium]|nr:Lrp/AsnC family transcriptional regulator [Burkholderiales bacterium]
MNGAALLEHASQPNAESVVQAHGLFNRWQRGLPLVARPYDALGAAAGLSGAQVIAALQAGLARGEVSRVGAVFGASAGGAGLLCAMQVPEDRIEAVAAAVTAEPGVNHNYAREHAWNLWFVVTATDRAQALACVARIEQGTGLAALRLPMRRAYRIDLGFDLFAPGTAPAAAATVEPVRAELRPLAARLEAGLSLVARPFAALGEPLGLSEDDVLQALAHWCRHGTVRRLGVVLRHHEFGIAANAMSVFALPEAEVDQAGARLATQPGVTLCYRRDSAPGWPYTLYCMVHGRERAAVRATLERAIQAAGLAACPREVLFSTRRFKQTGSRYFDPVPA